MPLSARFGFFGATKEPPKKFNFPLRKWSKRKWKSPVHSLIAPRSADSRPRVGIFGTLQDEFKIPHDGLRHTAISAHVSRHGSFAEAASQFGNSESMIRTHYFNRMSRPEAVEFYNIVPVSVFAEILSART